MVDLYERSDDSNNLMVITLIRSVIIFTEKAIKKWDKEIRALKIKKRGQVVKTWEKMDTWASDLIKKMD